MSSKLINEIIQLCIVECKKTKNKRKFEDEILSPTIEYILEKLKPYILITCCFLITMILLILSITIFL